ncbi:MAG: cytochrome d ubiquinol oxidase subunit II [Proteobacteria bacterium]|nr:cytochrome d ubiquinol oxidase subunit II [Pseudomonadota bacterium]
MDYEILRLLWWGLLGILFIGFAVLDGFDLGIGALLPFVGKNDEERRILINAVGPIWEANQVWLILGIGASFAAWPFLYSAAFTGLYGAVFLLLFSLILRPVGFKFRSKIAYPLWRHVWDWALCVGGAGPSFMFGVIVGNLFTGLPFYFDTSLRIFMNVSLGDLWSPFSVGCGFLSLSLVVLQGCMYGGLKTRGILQNRFEKVGQYAVFCCAILATYVGVWAMTKIPGFFLKEPWIQNGPSNPLYKEVFQVQNWSTNYTKYPWIVSFPISIYFFLLCAFGALYFKRWGLSFISSSLVIISFIITIGITLFPFLLPSSTFPSHSLTVWDASSSQTTLLVMLVATLIFMPLIGAYTIWVYRVLRGPITSQTLEDESLNAY